MSEGLRDRVLDVWRRVLALSWPVTAEHAFRTLMRTTDVVVTGTFSPAAVAAVGLADLYARLPLRIGLGLGAGAIALSSQDTGRAAAASRDEAVSQALAIGALAGVPLAAFGLLFGRPAIAILGAPPAVARMGGAYLAIIFATAPARHVALVGARSLQGTGDTRTPMYVNVVSNALNVVGSVVLGLGIGPAPELRIVGVGLATAFGNVFTAVALLAALRSARTAPEFVRPGDAVVTRQLGVVSAPRVAEGLVATAAEFPFNALLLGFGTEVNAAYQIGRRAYQQVTSPLSRGYSVAASVVVGQSLGAGEQSDGQPSSDDAASADDATAPADDTAGPAVDAAAPAGGAAAARFDGWATAALALLTVGVIGVGLFAGAEPVVRVFTRHGPTAEYAVGFTRAYGVAAPFLALFVVLSGSLQGGSDTRIPFVARTTGLVGFLLGFSYLASVVLGWGVVGVYAGIVLYYVWATLVVGWGFARGDWASRATAMMEERSADAGPD